MFAVTLKEVDDNVDGEEKALRAEHDKWFWYPIDQDVVHIRPSLKRLDYHASESPLKALASYLASR